MSDFQARRRNVVTEVWQVTNCSIVRTLSVSGQPFLFGDESANARFRTLPNQL